MKIILKESVYKLGEAGELVDVRPGYANNFLIPTGKAIFASAGAIKQHQHDAASRAAKLAREEEQARSLAEKLSSLSLTFPVKSNDEGKIFGSVTTQQIAQALIDKGYSVDKRKVVLNEDIKHLGEYVATVTLVGSVSASVKVWVVKAE
jgi:large subunit ribosomal protein L9